MKSFFLTAALLVGVCTIATDSGAQTQRNTRLSAKIYGDAERGKEITGMWCVSCHATGTTIDDRVPSLTVLAANPTRTDGAIRTFLMQPHRPMPPLELGNQQIEDIIAYLHTLRPQTGQSR